MLRDYETFFKLNVLERQYPGSGNVTNYTNYTKLNFLIIRRHISLPEMMLPYSVACLSIQSFLS